MKFNEKKVLKFVDYFMASTILALFALGLLGAMFLVVVLFNYIGSKGGM